MQQYGFDHIHLMSADAERAARFYEDNFGAKKVGARRNADGSANIELNLSGLRMVIKGTAGKAAMPRDTLTKSYGLEHFGINTDDLEASVAALKSAGVPFHEEIRQVRPGLRIAFVWAPDNVLVELMETKAT